MENSEVEINNTDYFLTLPGEGVIVAKRQYWLVILPNLLVILGPTILLLIGVYYLHIYTRYPVPVLYISILFIISITVTSILKTIIDWYYHFYIVTTRKILEINYSPFFWDKIDDVFLDQVRTTEVDIKINNIFQELFNIGDVIISFDRPSHDKLFILSNIHYPRQIGMLLGNELEANMQTSPVWFKQNKSNELIHSEDIGTSHPGTVII